MLILTNIHRDDNLISANYFYLRSSLDMGYVEYDIDKHHFKHIEYNKEDADKEHHAIDGTEKIFDQLIDTSEYPLFIRCNGY